MTEIIVALIGLIGLIASVTIPVVMGRRTQTKVDAVHAEVKTNHGLRAGEYMEMVAEVLAEARTHAAKVTQVEAMVTDLSQQWADHTISDAVSFDEISARLEGIEDHARRAAVAQARRRRGDAAG